MTMPPRLPLALLAAAAFACALPALAAKVDRNATVYAEMDAASARYREARIKIQAGDDASMAVLSKALEDLEEIAQRCLRSKGCDTTRVITSYETLLKSADLGPRDELVGEEDWDNSLAEPDHQLSPIVANSPEAARSIKILNDGHAFDKMVQVNEPVQAAIREWLTSQRAFLIDANENYQYMRYLMAPEYERSGLPEALLFGIMAKESGGKVHAVSRSGASGPLQFMPATGSRFGLFRDGTGFDWRFDPQQAARANAAYINERFAELNRNLEFTIAAYNGGEGRAARMYAASGGASFWSPQVMSQLPPETRDYVPAVIAAAWLFLHPKKYGLEFPKLDTTPGQITLAHASSINELTICLGNGGSRDGWFRVLRNLNPRYDASATIAGGTVLRAPKSIAALYTRNCVQGPRVQLAQELVRANRAWTTVGDVGASGGTPFMSSSAAVSAAMAKGDQGKQRSSDRGAKKKKSPGVYRVRQGDSLIGIAKNHGCDLGELGKANRLKSPAYRIQPGQHLKLTGCND
ncbi:MAG: transglycosylase SLT domain-containing protein [Arenimonas sp.]